MNPMGIGFGALASLSMVGANFFVRRYSDNVPMVLHRYISLTVYMQSGC